MQLQRLMAVGLTSALALACAPSGGDTSQSIASVTGGEGQQTQQSAGQSSGQGQLDLSVFVRNEAPWETNGVKPRIYVKNDSAVALANFELHYFFTAATNKTPVVDDLYTPRSIPRLEQLVGIPTGNPATAMWRTVYDFAGYTLPPGGNTDPNTPPSGNVVHLHYTDWSGWNSSDDWSFSGVSGTFIETDKIVVVDDDGNVVYGTAPEGVFEPEPEPEEPFELAKREWFSVQIPDEFDFAEVGVGASGSLSVALGGKVLGATTGSAAPAVNVGKGPTVIGQNAKTGSVYGRGATQIAAAQILGDVVSSDTLSVAPGASVSGTISPPFTQFDTRRRTFGTIFPKDSSPVPDIGQWQTHPLPPGSYGPLLASLNETFELNASGKYYFESLFLDNGSTLKLNNAQGPILVYVRDGFTFRGTIVKTDPAKHNVQFAVAGSSPVLLDKAFTGTVIAPRAPIHLAPPAFGKQHKGSFFGAKIQLQSNAILVHAPLVIDCTQEQALCRSSFACELPDEDGDFIPDCEEAADGDPWTDPEEANGFALDLSPACHTAPDFSCFQLDERAELEACGLQPIESRIMSAGWNWSGVQLTNSCDTDYGFLPGWDECTDSWYLSGSGFVRLPAPGRHCFAVGAGAGGCTSLFVGEDDIAVTSDDDSRCFDLPGGETILSWGHQGVGLPDAIDIRHCYGNLEDCVPIDDIPSDAIRPFGYLGGEDDVVSCNEDSECAGGKVCPDEPNGSAFGHGASERICVHETCETDPSLEGCSKPAETCNVAADCDAGQICLAIGRRFGDDVDQKYCWDDADEGFCGPLSEPRNCGHLGTKCGLCECTPDCSGAVCGVTIDDGCGFICAGACITGEEGCTSHLDCQEGDRCASGRCVPPSCFDRDECDPSICGDLCSGECVPDVESQECGLVEGDCVADLGDCGEGSTCTSGTCRAIGEDRPQLPARLPDDANVVPVGSLAGTFDVSDRGGASYSIPLDLPVGRGGVRPSLALTYTGDLSGGDAGAGWSVVGTSKITRCPKTAAVDGWPSPPVGAPDDAFCWNGQRIVLVSGTAGTDGAQYRTERESFNQITYRQRGEGSDAHDYWVIKPKAGGSMYFGRASVVPETDFAVTKDWLLTEVYNRSGVRTAYKYGYDASFDCEPEPGVQQPESEYTPGRPVGNRRCIDVSPLVTRINYGGLGTNWGPHDVRFSWQPDAGGHTLDQHLLGHQHVTEVIVEYAGEVIRTYQLEYTDVAGRSDFLESVRECVPGAGGTPVCNPATTFGYAGAAFDGDPATTLPAQFGGASEAGRFGAYTSCDNAIKNCPNTAVGHELFLDADGDGLLDVLSALDLWDVLPSGNLRVTRTWQIAHGEVTDDGFRFAQRYATNIKDVSKAGPTVALDSACLGPAGIQDLDGDGLTDLVDGCVSEDGSAHWWRSTGDNFQRKTLGTDFEPGEKVFLLDRNGDGYPEVASCRGGTLTLREWSSGEFGNGDPQVISTSQPGGTCDWQPNDGPEASPMIFDADANGVPELLVRDSDGVVYALSGTEPEWVDTGIRTRFEEPPPPPPNLGRGEFHVRHEPWKATYGPTRALDSNGDGLNDLVERIGIVREGSGVRHFHSVRTVREDATVTWRRSWMGKWQPFDVTVIDGSDHDPSESDGLSRSRFNRLSGVNLGSDRRQDLFGILRNGDDWVVTGLTDLEQLASSVLRVRRTEDAKFPDSAFEDNTIPPAFADFDGDGALDVLYANGDPGAESAPLRRLRFGLEPARYRLSLIVDGLGNRTDISYDEDGSAYTKGSCDVDRVCLPKVGPVVERVTLTSSRGLETVSNYAYKDAQVGRFGRGWLGFGERSTTVEVPAEGEDGCEGLTLAQSVHSVLDNGQLDTNDRRAAFENDKDYPFAGRPRQVVEETAEVDSGVTPVKSRFRTRQGFQYYRLVSDEQHPFVIPFAVETTFEQTIRDSDPTPPKGAEEEWSRLHYERMINGTIESLGVDQFGNVFYRTIELRDDEGQIEFTTIDTGFIAPDADNWEVGLPDLQTVEHETRSERKSRQMEFEYDSRGRLVRQTRAPNEADARVSVHFEYDDFGNVIETTKLADADGTPLVQSNSVIFDADGLRPMSSVGPTAMLTEYDVDAATGRIYSMIDPNGVITRYGYDVFGRRTRLIGPAGTSETHLDVPGGGADATFRVVSTDFDAVSSVTTVSEHDSLGRVLRTQSDGLDGRLITQATTYNCRGLVRTEELPHPTTNAEPKTNTYSYDALGNVIRVEGPDARGEPGTIEYRYATLLTAPAVPGVAKFTTAVRQTDFDGIESWSYSDSQGRTIASQRGGATSRVAYGAFGDVSMHSGPSGTEQIFTDAYGRLGGLVDPDLGAETYAFDAFDRVTLIMHADDSTDTFSYDELDRVTRITHDGFTEYDATEEFYYDSDSEAEAEGEPPTVNSQGRLVRAERHAGGNVVTQLFRFEPKPTNPLHNRALLDREILQVQIDDATSEFTTRTEYVDGTTRPSTIHYPSSAAGAFSVRYCYDGVGAPLSVVRAGADCAATDADAYWRRTKTRDGIAIESYRFGSGVDTMFGLNPVNYALERTTVSARSGNATLSFDYERDPGGRLKREQRRGTVAALEYDRRYHYNQSGTLDNVLDVTAGDELFELTYDSGLRLDTLGGTGLPALTAFSYKPLDGGGLSNRPEAVGGNTFAWDTRGNNEVRSGPDIPGGSQTITYNAFNLPASITVGTGTTEVTTFDHDAFGGRVYTDRFAGARRSWHVGTLYEKELESSGAEHHDYYVFAGGERVARFRRSRSAPGGEFEDRLTYLHHDRLGSLIATSSAAGNVLSEYSYDLFGEPRQPLPIPFGYTGHRYESDFGVTDASGRFYDARFGFFLSADPVGPLNGGSSFGNRYSYVGYDPVNFFDPTGLQTDCLSYPNSPDCKGQGGGSGGLICQLLGLACESTKPGIVAPGASQSGRKADADVPRNPGGSSPKQTAAVHAAGAAAAGSAGHESSQGSSQAFGVTPAVGADRYRQPWRFTAGLARDMSTRRLDGPHTPDASGRVPLSFWENDQTLANAQYGFLGMAGVAVGIASGAVVYGIVGAMIADTLAGASLIGRLGLVSGVGLGGGGAAARGALNWTWKSTKTFGHTFKTHGAGEKVFQRLLDRARTVGQSPRQGQWLDNAKAAEFLSGVRVSGPATVRLPSGLGQIIHADGSVTAAQWVRVAPSPNGGFISAFPFAP